MELKLSICITVYNQIELVRGLLKDILSYPEDDIEVVISDDCSTDKIREMAEEWKDSRIVYCKTEKNIGHDLNILHGLSHCRSRYIFLLRSRDRIIPDGIKTMIEVTKKYPKASYFDFSACDEDGRKRIILSNKVYPMGRSACKAHARLLVHPSGHLYVLDQVDFQFFERYIRKYFSHNFGFTVHDLLRIYLAGKGDFVTSERVTWQYTNTKKVKDVAVNSAPDHISVYAPQYEYSRFQCQFDFIQREAEEYNRICLWKNIIRRFYKSTAFDFYYRNRDESLQHHYHFTEQRYSKKEERKRFRILAKKMFCGISWKEQLILYVFVYYQTLLLFLYYPIKYKISQCLSDSEILPLVLKWIRRI